jgi:hypothetical protein
LSCGNEWSGLGAHERGYDEGYAAAISDARLPGSRAHAELSDEGASPDLRDDATGEPGQKATESGASEGEPRRYPFGRIRITLDLDGNTQTIAQSGLIHLDNILSGEPKSPLDLAASVSDAIDEVIEAVQRTVKLFGCQGILEQIKAEAPKEGVTP